MKRIIAILLMGVIGLSGCSSTSLVSTDAWGIETRAALEEWIVAEVDASVAASGLSEGWVRTQYGVDAEVPRYWDSDRHEIISSITTLSCYSGGHAYPKQLYLTFAYDDPPKPFEAIAGVRTRWQAEGWEVTDIYPLDDDQSKTMQHVAARRGDGALLSIQGTEEAIVLSVSSVCSVHGSV